MRLTPDQVAELEAIRREAGGVLDPDAVLDRARSANSSLHGMFPWDDEVAAERHRLFLARSVIRAVVTLLPRPDGALVPVRAYVAIGNGGGYRATVEVLREEENAMVLLSRLRSEVARAAARYRRHAELAPHIDAALRALAPPEDAL